MHSQNEKCYILIKKRLHYNILSELSEKILEN